MFSLLKTVVFASMASIVAQAAQAPSHRMWEIGTPDLLDMEFGPGSSSSLLFRVRQNKTSDWRRVQNADDKAPPRYRVQFQLERAPAADATLGIEVYFIRVLPERVIVEVNGKRGTFHVQPLYAKDLDYSRSWSPSSSRASFRIAVERGWLRAGSNEIAISWYGEGASVHYDAVWLDRDPTTIPTLSLEPTVFFQRSGAELLERADAVVPFRNKVGNIAVSVRIGGKTATASASPGDYEFGDWVVPLTVAAIEAPAPYELTAVCDGVSQRTHGTFVPQKRWKLYATFKIHNDVGYTDVQSFIQEADTRNIDTVLGLMDRFPFYRFNLENSWLADNYLNSRGPGRTKQFVDRAREGRLGIAGLYLDSLTQIESGEQLYRSVYPLAALHRNSGVPMLTASACDVPAHSWFIPTLLADTGMIGFAAAYNQDRSTILVNGPLGDHSPFWWEGADGRRTLAFIARHYHQIDAIVDGKPIADRMRRGLPAYLLRFSRPDYAPDALMFYGLYHDNVEIGGVRNGYAEFVAEWNRTYEYPKIIPATDADYFQYIAENFGKRLPVYRGDGGGYWTDGTASAAAETAIYRKAQALLPAAEALFALNHELVPEEAYPAREFASAWRELLFYADHSFGGSSSGSTPDSFSSREQWEYKRAFADRGLLSAKDLLHRSWSRVASHIDTPGPTLYVFNTGFRAHTGPVEAELRRGQQILDLTTGKPVPVDLVSIKDGIRNVRLLAEKVPGLGYKAYRVERQQNAADVAPLKSDLWSIESRFYRVALDPHTGAIRDLFDKDLGRDLCDQGAPALMNQLLHVTGGAGTLLINNTAGLTPPELAVKGQSDAKLLENVTTPFGHRIRIQSRAESVPTIETEITVYNGLKRVDIVNRIQKEQVREKESVYFAFPFAVEAPELSYQAPNAWVRMNQDQLPGAGKEWVATQNLARVRGKGLAILWATADAPVVAFTDIIRGRWPRDLDIRNGHVYSWAMDNVWTNGAKPFQDGPATFRYSITSARSFSDAEEADFDETTRTPLLPYMAYQNGNGILHSGPLPAGQGSFIDVDAGPGTFSAVKQAEDGNGMILRIRNTSAQRYDATIGSKVIALKSAYLCDGVERNIRALAVTPQGIKVPVPANAFATVRILSH